MKKTEADLLLAVRKGDIQLLRQCIAHRVNLNAKDEQGTPAVILAVLARHNYEESLSYLLVAGADPNIPSEVDRWTALDYTLYYRRPVCFALLRDKGGLTSAELKEKEEKVADLEIAKQITALEVSSLRQRKPHYGDTVQPVMGGRI